jgi:hypothetical protein
MEQMIGQRIMHRESGQSAEEKETIEEDEAESMGY